MANTSYDILLKFILDQSSQQKTEAGVKSLNKALDETEKHVHDINQTGHDPGLMRAMDEAAKVAREKLNPELDKTADRIKRANAEAKLLRAQANAIVNDLNKARIAQMRQTAGMIEGVGRGALVGGTALAGGIFLAAKNYIKDAEQSDRLTRQWAASTKEIEKAQERIGRVAAQAVLPTLQKAADIAEKVAEFTEAHPEIIQAAFNTGLFVAGFGALAIAVGKGIRLVADIKYLATIPAQLAAAKLQDQAADKQLLAAGIRAKSLGVSVPGGAAAGGGLLAGGVGAIAATVAAVLGGVVVGGIINDMLAKAGVKGFAPSGQFATVGARGIGSNVIEPLAVRGGMSPEEAARKTLVFTAIVGKLTGVIDENSELWKKAAASIKKSGDIVEQVTRGLAGSEHEKEIVGAFQKWQEDDARIVSEAAEKRVQIVRDAEKRVVDETARFNKQVSSINSGAARRAQSITENYLKADEKSEIDYQEQRAKILKDSGKEIRRIEEDHQERLRKLRLEHDERMEDLTASRDALGLVKEQRRFLQAQAEENRGTRGEIAQRRQDLAERLAELDREHQIEQAQRLAQFQQDLAENEAQRKEAQKEAAIAHAEELKQIRVAKATQLRELQEGLNAERLRRREIFIAEIRDLDASLLGERGLKARYYNLMLADAEKWLAAYRAKLASAATAKTPTHDYTGYAYSGMYRMAANGQPEYVLSGAATRAAEQVIGGRLTQDAMLSTLMRCAGRGGSRSVTYNDQRRFNSSVPLSERRAIVQETVEAIRGELR